MKIRKLNGTLELKNDGHLSLFFIGTGSAFSKKHFQNNLLVIKGEDHLLIDCGSLCPYAIEEYGRKITDIRNFYLTHSHADHIGGMEEVALRNYYEIRQRPKIIITDEYKKILWNESLHGGCAYGETTDGHSISFEDYFSQIKPVKIPGTKYPLLEANLGNINIKIFDTVHLTGINSKGRHFHSTGIIIDDRIVFSGDARFDYDKIMWMVKHFNIECIFHDSQRESGGVHAAYNDLKSLPEDVRGKTFLCHYSDTPAIKEPEKDGFLGYAKRAHYYNF